jgi:GNAT superfamily N-acetyltransferase
MNPPDERGIRSATEADAALLASLISQANQDVARQFGLTPDTCPKHPSQCEPSWIVDDLRRGVRYFLLETDAGPVGCVAYETPRPGRAYLNRLSVLPAHRRQGHGAALVRHVQNLARLEGATVLSIGVIDAHTALGTWYRRLGFVDGEVKHFEHLPFAVRYMTCGLSGGWDEG